MAATCALVLLVGSGCGGDGTSDVTIKDPTVEESQKLSGIVSAPYGVLASAPRWWEGLSLVSSAQAAQGLFPVGPGLPVSLSELDANDFADGAIDSPRLVLPAVVTDTDGRFTFIAPEALDVTNCRKMVAVGNGETLTRALVFSRQVAIDATSEALVRVLMEYVHGSRAQLCDFSAYELSQLYRVVSDATYLAYGDDVASVNEDAFRRAWTNKTVQRTLEAIAAAVD